MEIWGSIILYGFIAYLFIHLVLEDVVYVFKTLNQQQAASRYLPGQEGDVTHVIDQSIPGGDIENNAKCRNTDSIFPGSENTLSLMQTENKRESSENEHKNSDSGNRNSEAVQSSYFYSLQNRHIQNSEQYTAILLQQKQRQSSVIILFYKLADITLACVMGYFHIFQVCWIACLSCLQIILLRYIDFLQDLTHKLADKEVVKYTAGSAVVCVAIACTTICVVFSIMR